MAELDTEIRYLKGIGEKKAQAFQKLGVFTLYDLLSFFPRRYEDRSVYKPISLAEQGETVCIRALVADTPRLSRIRRGLDLVRFRIVDESGMAEVTYFNQSYRKDSIHKGESYVFYGKIEVAGTRRSLVNPVCEREENEGGVTGHIIPVYRLTGGLTQRNILLAMRQALNEFGEGLPELLPEPVRRAEQLCPARYAYENIHFPADFQALEIARRRLIFEELFVLACALGRMRGERVREQGLKIRPVPLEEFWRSLPFSPTGAQRRAAEEALSDMESGQVMNRLVQGDVGSGKTLVAAALIWAAWKNGLCSAFMAPTEILAQQHLATLTAFLSPFGIRVGKLTGSTTAKEKRAIKAALQAGELDLIIGTHALFSADVEYSNLGLVITDEQHRFGVGQRSALIGKGQRPHVLVMSATPIPRTLALILYGDLDVSVIDELPPGRQKVDTFTVNETYRARLNGFIRKLAEEGRQIFVVCPMVEENDELPMQLKSAEEHAKTLQEAFPELRVACVHGKLKAKEKDAVMGAFVAGETDVLVSTTVIEVGVDVPNAALMVVENAERFGLSQLHQLRGRVGRGQHKSWCILVSDAEGEDVRARLDILCKTNDGFKVAEEDLRLRGPGDFFGSRQSGLPEMHVADLGADAQILQKAQQAALKLLDEDPGLSAPEHRELCQKVDRLFQNNADSFN